MTFDEFIKKYNGVGVDYDKQYGVQCCDLANQYNKDVIGCGMFMGACAADFFNNFAQQTVKGYFTKITNTANFVPKKGDIVFWAKSLNGSWGHVAICDGVGNTEYFYSYDQNWDGKNHPCERVKHSYAHVMGVLRPKDQTKVNGTLKTLDTAGYKKGDKSIGVLALKQLLFKAGYSGMANDKGYGAGTVKAVNNLLKSWGYKQTGVAGEKFIKKLGKLTK